MEVEAEKVSGHERVETSMDFLVIAYDDFNLLLASKSTERWKLEAGYKNLKRRARIAIDEVHRALGPSSQAWLNRALVVAERCLNDPSFTTGRQFTAETLRGQSTWLRNRGLSAELTESLNQVADALTSYRVVGGLSPEKLLEKVCHLSHRYEADLLTAERQAWVLTLEEVELIGDPEERAHLLEPLHEKIVGLLDQFESQDLGLYPQPVGVLMTSVCRQLQEIEEELQLLVEQDSDLISDQFSQLQENIKLLDEAIYDTSRLSCPVCGQLLPPGITQCAYCGGRVESHQLQSQGEHRLLAELDQQIHLLQSGLGQVADLQQFLVGETRRLDRISSQVVKPTRPFLQAVAKLREGFYLLSEVQAPGDLRLGRGRELVENGVRILEALTE